MNILGIPCVTLRFGTDRGESLLAGGNVLAPPIDSGFVADIIEGALADPELGEVPSSVRRATCPSGWSTRSSRDLCRAPACSATSGPDSGSTDDT